MDSQNRSAPDDADERATFAEQRQRHLERRGRGKPSLNESSYVHFDWEVCSEKDCAGVHLPGSELCLAHAAHREPAAFRAAIQRVRKTGEVDIRGTTVDALLFANLLDAAPMDDEGTPYIRKARCEAAVFDCDAAFSHITLHEASFNAAQFRAFASFHRFTGPAWFQDTTFSGYTSFDGCIFEDRLRLENATFTDLVHLGATFKGDVSCPGVAFLGDMMVQIFWATFEVQCNLGPIVAKSGVLLSETTFHAPAVIRIHSPWTNIDRCRFLGGASIGLRGGDVIARGTEFGPLSVLWDNRDDKPSDIAQVVGMDNHPYRTKLLSVDRASLSELTLTDIDISDCLFVGGRGLDKLTLEGSSRFPTAGSRWDWRRVIADEREWRFGQGYRKWIRIRPYWPEGNAWFGKRPSASSTEAIAETYRALRRGREDVKDEPGSADFYYGEMEMRRLSGRQTGEKGRGIVERSIVTAYWLTSGYALRAGRAFVFLLVTVVLFSVLLHYFGFDPKAPLSETLLYSAKSTSSLFKASEQLPKHSLTYTGELLQLVLRLLGPLFFGLILLSIRGRIKR